MSARTSFLFLPLRSATPAMNALASSAPTIEIASHRHLACEHHFTIALPLADAFTFFEPVGEKRWAAGWNPVFASREDATLHDGSVFTVSSPAPDGEGTVEAVWTVSRYEPPQRIEYRNVLIGVRATQIVVRCEAIESNVTKVVVRYVYHGLSARGDAFIDRMTEKNFARMIANWGAEIAAYLARGTPASP